MKHNEGGARIERAYVNFRDPSGKTALFGSIGFGDFFFPFSEDSAAPCCDAGANTISKARLISRRGGRGEWCSTTRPWLSRTITSARRKSQEMMPQHNQRSSLINRLEGVRRLLLRVGAVHAFSVLAVAHRWPRTVYRP